MEAERQQHHDDERQDNTAGLRRCLATGDSLPKSALIRFVVSPDGEIVADPEERLPGRGLWLRADRDIMEKACASNLFSKAARRQVAVPDDLCDRVAMSLRRRCLNLIGLARRGGQLAGGAHQVREKAANRTADLLLSASDGSPDECAKMRGLVPEVPVIDLFSAAELGQAVGRDHLVHAALEKGGLATKLLREADRLAAVSSRQGMKPAAA